MTLLPGDVISTGTPFGVGLGLDPQKYLKDGDMSKRESPYFWIWYPTLREILSKNFVFNEKNNTLFRSKIVK